MRFKKTTKVLGLVLISLVVLAVYLGVSYVSAGAYLKGIIGNDTAVFLSRVKLMEESFPSYSFWNYKEGGGVVLSYNYPILVHSLIIGLTKISSLNVIEWAKILGWLSIPLFGFGVYLFGLLRLRTWVVGFLAGLFYILSPIAYIWPFTWGFYAEAVAGIFFPLIVLFFDLYLEGVLKQVSGWKQRLYFGLTAGALSLGFLSHPMVFLAGVMWVGFYGLLMAGFKRWGLVIGKLLKLMVAVLVLVSFWVIPFVVNNQIAAAHRGTASGFNQELIYYNDIDLKQVLSLWLPEGEEYARFRQLSFPLGLSVLVPIGGLMAVILKRKRLVVGLIIGLGAILVSVSPEALIWLYKLPGISSLAKNSWFWRILIYADRLMIPILAAWGIYGVVHWLIPFKKVGQRRWLRGLRVIVVAGLVVIMAGGWLWYWRNKPGEIKDRIRYGLGVSECNVWQSYQKGFCVDQPKSFKESLMDEEKWMKSVGRLRQEKLASLESEKFLKTIPGGEFWRMSFTPNGGGLMKVAPAVAKTALMTSYDWTSVLFDTLLFIQQSNFFYQEDLTYVEPKATREMAGWFGIKYVVINPKVDPEERFREAGFEKLEMERLKEGLEVYHLPQGEPIVRLDNRPRILVIGRQDFNMYDLVFRKAMFNLVEYDKAMLIDGGEYISDYSEEELEQFEMIWLYGHEYKGRRNKERDQQKAWRLLDKYIKNGGRLFMDSGWQFTTDDWELETTAEFYPTESLVWQELDKAKDYQLTNQVVSTEGIELAKFRPLVWEDKAWGVSTSDSLRDWAKPILSVKNTPLIAGGEYGKGRVIWSGMNILNHIEGFDWDNEEGKLVKRLVDWLLEGYGEGGEKLEWEKDYSGERVSPDKVELTINQSLAKGYGVYFKEADHPYWQAMVISGDDKVKQEIYRAGPGFKYVFLPEVKQGDKLVLEVVRPWWYGGLKLLAIGSGIGLGVWVVRPDWMRLSGQSRWRSRLNRWWEKDDDE